MATLIGLSLVRSLEHLSLNLNSPAAQLNNILGIKAESKLIH